MYSAIYWTIDCLFLSVFLRALLVTVHSDDVDVDVDVIVVNIAAVGDGYALFKLTTI